MAEATQLKSRHLTMMGLGSAVGAGLFLGVGLGIQISGTSVLISYAVAGALIALVMWMLGEMAAARPSLGSFSTYAGQAYGLSLIHISEPTRQAAYCRGLLRGGQLRGRGWLW